MTFYSLASSSSANCYLYDFGDVKILIDVGMARGKIIKKLKEIDVDYEDIDFIFITHEHSDHIKGLEQINKHDKNKKIFLTEGTLNAVSTEVENHQLIKNWDGLEFGDVVVDVIPVSHDASEPVAFVFNYRERKMVHLLDTGYILKEVKDIIKDAYFYVIESNYDEEALITNVKYPYNIKKRILSDVGHLSNVQCYEYLKEVTSEATSYVCYGHLSPKNNTKDLVHLMNDNFEFNKVVLEKDLTVQVSCE